MFIDESLRKVRVEEGNIHIGDLQVNVEMLKKNDFILPFTREKEGKTITKIGTRDYKEMNKIIIGCMNDYYNRVMNSTKVEREKMLSVYNRLYDLWRELHNSKANLIELDKIYDLFSYELYILGYQI